MPGGLIQLVNKGAQDQLVTGSPSFTHFRSLYKRHTEFAMEHFRLDFLNTNLDLNPSTPRVLKLKVDRNAQLVHDMYIHVSLPDIYSPINPITRGRHPEIAPDATGIPYEFQWIDNLGYNMINSVSILVNGTAIVTHTGEWMKIYSYITHDANKRKLVDKMVGNVKELTDPANAYSRVNQYPHSITTTAGTAQPSILGRNLVIPLHFWFCECIGAALPLVSLQYSEVEISIEFAPIYSLFTVKDVRDSNPKGTFGHRIAPDPASREFDLSNFLGPPSAIGTPINSSLNIWSLRPYVEANYIFLSDVEMANFAKSDASFMIKQTNVVRSAGLYGAGNDIELNIHNLCTRVVWVLQRSDAIAVNDYDNYTNHFEDAHPTFLSGSLGKWFTSGPAVGQNQSADDILVDAVLVFDGGDRFGTKTYEFFSLLENYKHHTGAMLPGIYSYSFALEHKCEQPSGHVNGSMFNKTNLRLTLQDPPSTNVTTPATNNCILASSAFNPNPVVIASIATIDPGTKLLRVINKGSTTQVRNYTYNARVFVESYNFLRISRGIANVVFSS